MAENEQNLSLFREITEKKHSLSILQDHLVENSPFYSEICNETYETSNRLGGNNIVNSCIYEIVGRKEIG